jgi:hypothetical protein
MALTGEMSTWKRMRGALLSFESLAIRLTAAAKLPPALSPPTARVSRLPPISSAWLYACATSPMIRLSACLAA